MSSRRQTRTASASRYQPPARTHWRPPTRTYEYNYNFGEHYYRPLTRYLAQRDYGRKDVAPPGARTFAERLAVDPIQGVSGRNWADRDYPTVPLRPASMFWDEQPSRQAPGAAQGRSPGPQSMDDDFLEPRARARRLLPRLGFSDKMLDTVGLKTPDMDRILNGPRSAGVLDDEPFFFRRNRRASEDLGAAPGPETLNWENEILGARARAKAKINDIEKEFEDETGVPSMENRWMRSSRNVDAVSSSVRMRRKKVTASEKSEKTTAAVAY